ncbi:damage-inducible protein [Staphylococcus condimenti]|uniref:AAA family ATPase n=2 Tax=Staphylococcus condimenti TaxID=70255 RepID=A0AB37HCT1_9STAP|nr:DnaB helicase C-terminal domain-containing protein [Staphylococcus condimenti]AMY05081.1 damage-inducible protein [Staphylococcus condimenti]PNZ59359.1 damage-inducible protein [Staphylococcus condimenti]QQS83119.1 AAA family ATPase [Staphylococcus condimenti]QRP94446.1 AAA family ATPase [Staphylococcus condimenti]VEG64665.1 prophage L54a, replicative DNA helicase [Staphylococcus condimenti]
MYNINEIESTIVASLLKKPDLLQKLRVKPDMFTNVGYSYFITFILEKGSVELNELFIKSAKDKGFISNDELAHLYNTDFVGVGYFESYQDDIIHAYQRRESERLANMYQQDDTTSIRELIDNLQAIELLDKTEDTGTKEYVNELIEEIYSDAPNNKIKTGFPLMDYKIGGFEPSQLVVIAARPSVGKTAFALNLLWNVAKSGYQTTFFSIETTGKNVLQRMLASICKIELTKIKEVSNLTVDDITNLTKGLDDIMHNNVNIVAKSSITTQDVRAQTMKQTDKPQVIFIDYLQLMQTDAKIDRRVAIERISRDLKIIANETDAIIVILSQLSRGVESRNDKRPMLSDMKESGGIEADASIAMLLYREDYYDKDIEEEDGKSTVECNIAKNKDGETGVIEFDFYKRIQRFYT